jgi:CRP-like cAMP-binding protein
MQTTISMLKEKLQGFYPISDEDFEKLAGFIFEKRLKRKECLVSENELQEDIFFVTEGVLRKYFRRNKNEIITQFFLEGDFANAIFSFFTGSPSQFSIEAIEPSKCLGIHKKDLERVLAEVPSLEKLYRIVLSSLYIKKEMEEYDKARLTKQERFFSFCEEQTDLLQRVPQKFIASYLEIAPETFCRMKHIRYKAARKAIASSN